MHKKSSQYCKNILKGFTLFYSFTSSVHCFCPHGLAELVYTTGFFKSISCLQKCLQITCKAGCFTGDIHNTVYPIGRIFGSAFGWIPSRGGSRTITSGFSVRSSRTFRTSPAMNLQLSSPFSFAFSLAAATASSTISTPITSFATGASSCAIVPVPLIKIQTLPFHSYSGYNHAQYCTVLPQPVNSAGRKKTC